MLPQAVIKAKLNKFDITISGADKAKAEFAKAYQALTRMDSGIEEMPAVHHYRHRQVVPLQKLYDSWFTTQFHTINQ